MSGNRFELGTLQITPGATKLLREHLIDPHDLVARHAQADWGDLDRRDRAVNNRALKEGLQLMSWYQVKKDGPPRLGVWVITTWDRSTTTILTPDEY